MSEWIIKHIPKTYPALPDSSQDQLCNHIILKKINNLKIINGFTSPTTFPSTDHTLNARMELL